MTYKLKKELVDGKPVKLSLGVPEVDAYLKFLEHRCRPNTWLSYGYVSSLPEPDIEAGA